jgi:hypothetical protein
MEGVGGTGLYGEERVLANMLRADKQQFENAPLSARQRKALQKKIEETRGKLKLVRAKIRENSPLEQEIQCIMKRHGWNKTQATRFTRERNRLRKEAKPTLKAIRESTRGSTVEFF